MHLSRQDDYLMLLSLKQAVDNLTTHRCNFPGQSTTLPSVCDSASGSGLNDLHPEPPAIAILTIVSAVVSTQNIPMIQRANDVERAVVLS